MNPIKHSGKSVFTQNCTRNSAEQNGKVDKILFKRDTFDMIDDTVLPAGYYNNTSQILVLCVLDIRSSRGRYCKFIFVLVRRASPSELTQMKNNSVDLCRVVGYHRIFPEHIVAYFHLTICLQCTTQSGHLLKKWFHFKSS